MGNLIEKSRPKKEKKIFSAIIKKSIIRKKAVSKYY
jgi:hypothetical protein